MSSSFFTNETHAREPLIGEERIRHNELALRACVRMLCRMEALTRWSSLSDQIQLANELFGPPIGEQKVAAWFDEQISLVEDVDFAQEFASHVQLSGIEVLDYAPPAHPLRAR